MIGFIMLLVCLVNLSVFLSFGIDVLEVMQAKIIMNNIPFCISDPPVDIGYTVCSALAVFWFAIGFGSIFIDFFDNSRLLSGGGTVWSIPAVRYALKCPLPWATHL